MYLPEQIQEEAARGARAMQVEFDDAVEALDRIVRDAQSRYERAAELHGALRNMRATFRSRDGLVEITSNALGSIRQIRFDSERFDMTTPTRLADALITTMREATTAADRRTEQERRRRGLGPSLPPMPKASSSDTPPGPRSGDLGEQLAAAMELIDDVEVTCTALDRSVSVIADGKGEVLRFEFPATVTADYEPEHLADSVLQAIAAAQRAAGAMRARTIRDLTVEGVPLAQWHKHPRQPDEIVNHAFGIVP